jgi:hypothetical protein
MGIVGVLAFVPDESQSSLQAVVQPLFQITNGSASIGSTSDRPEIVLTRSSSTDTYHAFTRRRQHDQSDVGVLAVFVFGASARSAQSR